MKNLKTVSIFFIVDDIDNNNNHFREAATKL